MGSSIRPTDPDDPHGAWSKIYRHPIPQPTNDREAVTDEKVLAFVSAAIEAQPYTAYSYVAQNAKVEATRATKHARLIATIAVRRALAALPSNDREQGQ